MTKPIRQFLQATALLSLLLTNDSLACTKLSNLPIPSTLPPPPTIADMPPDRLEAHQKAQSIIDDQSNIKGSKQYLERLIDLSKYIYIGTVSSILSQSDRADEAEEDARYAYVKVSKGWKSGKVRQIRLKVTKNQTTCENLYLYNLKEKNRYLFFEGQQGLITALPINTLKSGQFAADGVALLGDSDWYYSRNSTIHYTH